jgi:hypothetical protein
MSESGRQTVRSANGGVSLYPVAVDGVSNLAAFEHEVARILESVYDNAVGYSLRDRDEAPAEINDVGPIKRFRLNCRAAENLLLSDDVLARANLNWDELKQRLNSWIEGNAQHPHYDAIKAFATAGFDRKNADLKDIRNDLVGIMGSNAPWEILVGKAIAALVNGQGLTGDDSLTKYLGVSLCGLLRGSANVPTASTPGATDISPAALVEPTKRTI